MGRDVQGSRTRIKAEPHLGAYLFQTPLPAFLQSLFDRDKSSRDGPDLQRQLTFFFWAFHLSDDF